jgi:hypothetical protein
MHDHGSVARFRTGLGIPVTKPTADTTAAAETWLRSHRDLHSLLDEALDEPEIAELLAQEGIPPAEARSAIVEDPNIPRQLRSVRELRTVWANDVAARAWGLRSRRLAGAPPGVRVFLAVLVVVAYLALTFASAPVLPLWGSLFVVVGFVAAIGFAAGLAGEEVWSLVIVLRNARDPASWQRYALDEVLLPRLFQFVGEWRAPDHGTTLPPLQGLRNLYDDNDEAPIITSAGRRLRQVMDRSTSDAVAIAGYRGVGKTTAIRTAARGTFSEPGAPPPMSVLVSAPSRYEARDFVLHLHAVLAKQVIALTGKLLGQPQEPEFRGRRGRTVWLTLLRWFVASVLLPAILLALAYLTQRESFPRFVAELGEFGAVVFTDFPERFLQLLWVFDDQPANVVLELNGFSVVFVIAAVLLAGVSTLGILAPVLARLLGVLIRGSRASALPGVATLRAEALRQRDRVRFLQTYTSGWSGKVGIPLGSDIGWTRGSQRVEQQATHPEVVDAFREFAARAAEVLAGQGAIGRILIAVDELDKIAEPDLANEFVNDIKGIFGIRGCLFLVAVSEDAISAFERRGIPVRDAFDSAFSVMVRMDPFTLPECRRWMGRRLLGVPVAFSCLCHCLSGGLPRDLRRSTIDMVDAVEETGSRELGPVAARMVGWELDRKAHAFAAAARRLDDSPEVAAHLADLLLIGQVSTPGELVELAERLAPDASSTMPRMRWQSACFVLFCATVREVFTDDFTKSALDKGIELLGEARAQLAIDPRVAWRVVCDVRERFSLAPGRSGPP